MIDFKNLRLIGSSTARGHGIDTENSYLSLLQGRWPALVASNESQDLLGISRIVDILRRTPDSSIDTVLIIHSAADTFLIAGLPYRLFLRMKSAISNSAHQSPGYTIYKYMNRNLKLLFFCVRFLKLNTGLISFFRSVNLIDSFSADYRHTFVIVDTTSKLFSIEWFFKGLYSRLTSALLESSLKITVIDIKKIIDESQYVHIDFYQRDRWHLNELGHDFLSNEITLRLRDLGIVS
jgi:hypothetical protein